ncbi:unnamed protein product, partial [Mesorhabditis belari]|uniref:Uncharacterized protein n=1 Tax=Mesorhabditis belari TaxID=2138241 RepID=A0AAF3EEU4_9BILA
MVFTIRDFLFITDIILNVICIISIIVTLFTVFIIVGATPVKSRYYARFLLWIELCSLLTVIFCAWLSPIVAAETKNGLLVCLRQRPFIYITRKITDIFQADPIISLAITKFCFDFLCASNVLGYFHALVYRHQVSVRDKSRLHLNKWKRYLLNISAYVCTAIGLGIIEAGLTSVDMSEIEFLNPELSSYFLSSDFNCAVFRSYVTYMTIVVGIGAFGAFVVMIFLVLHSYLSIRSHMNMHKKIQELALNLLYSMSAQVFVFSILLFTPFTVLVILYVNRAVAFTQAWKSSTVTVTPSKGPRMGTQTMKA